jgi:hypothetical protein
VRHGSRMGTERQAAGLRLSVAGTRRNLVILGSHRTRSRRTACGSDRHVSSEEDICTATNKRLLRWMKAARNHRQQDVE